MNFAPWYQCTETDENPILSSRIRLARNIANFPFHGKLSDDSAHGVIELVDNSINKINQEIFDNHFIAQDLDAIERQVSLEKHILSPKYLDSHLPNNVYVDMSQNTSIMINEEDHVRIQAVLPGANLAQALAKASEVDNLLEHYLDFAFDADLGYLTACPTNVGTGLRASFMVHLPCLEKTDMLKKLFPYIAKSGMTLRGIYGEGTISMGSIYQLSNQVTLGVNEAAIIKNLNRVAEYILKREEQTRDKMTEKRQNYVQDKAYRAYGTLAFARTLDVKEAMSFLSDIRLGYLSGMLKLPRPEESIYQIMMEIQAGHLHAAVGKVLDQYETDIARAIYLRSIFVA